MLTVQDAKNEIKILETFWKSIRQFENIEATEYRRKEMSGLLKKYVERVGIFTRINEMERGRMVINLHYQNPFWGMSPDVSIYLVDNKFRITDCTLVRTLEGLHEFVQEHAG